MTDTLSWQVHLNLSPVNSCFRFCFLFPCNIHVVLNIGTRIHYSLSLGEKAVKASSWSLSWWRGFLAQEFRKVYVFLSLYLALSMYLSQTLYLSDILIVTLILLVSFCLCDLFSKGATLVLEVGGTSFFGGLGSPFSAITASTLLGRLSTRFIPQGLKSGLCAGQSSSSTRISTNTFCKALGLCMGALSRWNRKGPSPNCCHKVGKTELSRMALYAI